MRDTSPTLELPDNAPRTELLTVHPNGTKPVLFVAGGVHRYYSLARLLGEDQPLCGLAPQGLDGRRLPFTSIEARAVSFIAEMRKKQPHGPYHLCGHSADGLAVLEMARRLKEDGEEIALLALIEPSRPGANGRTLREWVAEHRDAMSGLSASGQLRYGGQKIVERISSLVSWTKFRLYRLWSKPVPPSLVQRSVIEALEQSVVSYQPEPYGGDAVLFVACGNGTRPLGPRAVAYFRDLVSGRLEERNLPGNHASILEEPSLSVLAAALSEYLDHAPAASPAIESERPQASSADGLPGSAATAAPSARR